MCYEVKIVMPPTIKPQAFTNTPFKTLIHKFRGRQLLVYLELSISIALLTYGEFRMAFNGRKHSAIGTLDNTVNIDLPL